MQCFAQKRWVQASRWMPLYTHLSPKYSCSWITNCSGGPSRILANYSGTAWRMWQRTQGSNLVSRGGPNQIVHVWHMWGFWGSVFALTRQSVNTGPLGVSCGVCCELRPPLIRLMPQMVDCIGNLEASLTPEHFFVVWVGTIVRLGGRPLPSGSAVAMKGCALSAAVFGWVIYEWKWHPHEFRHPRSPSRSLHFNKMINDIHFTCLVLLLINHVLAGFNVVLCSQSQSLWYRVNRDLW